MDRVVELIGSVGVVPVVRTPEPGLAQKAGEALVAGGARVLEVALTCPDALEAIAGLAERAAVGAASVSSVELLEEAVRRGAAFTVSPHLDRALMDRAGELGIVHVPGVATPTEVVAASRAGAEPIKLFPAGCLGGPTYLRTLLAPLPGVKLVPAGGVVVDEVTAYLGAGAFAVAVGSDLVRGEWLRGGAWESITSAMRSLCARLP
jgi:2-dehydro-3-deoxyphosphogluconate aldolase/(4S)-4-hydroxy-2-oxoglutarate aldolase